ncbi:hypothetical protein [Neptuniibacter pectenicola]|uniref:hypothetical protein n=1 Tax=Neptuniibacter pectenicola TaxID=1806669 RepID=UPI00082D35F0|nr:hypothetical protein [Neptuniibacter pectenicola]
MKNGRWSERCVSHYDESVLSFFQEHFSCDNKKCLVIGGAGFDPRSTEIISELSSTLKGRLSAFMIKEERPQPDDELIIRADENLNSLKNLCSNLDVEKVEIFSDDGAVVAGHNIIKAIRSIDLDGYTDIVVDMSAMSMGISFPIILYLSKMVNEHGCTANIHIAIISNPDLDSSIKSEPNDQPSDVRGCDREALFGSSQTATLWLPLLTKGKEQLLKIIHSNLKPHDTCPILPFPADDPKKGDLIAYSYFSEIHTAWGGALENEWGLEPQNFLYSDERNPLDIYRTILRISQDRQPVFEALGGSTIVLSPLGSKIPAIGALMAALDKKFPIVYVEALSYNVDWEKLDSPGNLQTKPKLTHIWLYGDAYA